MGAIKEFYNVENIFGDLGNFIIRTNYPEEIKVGEVITIVNPNCEFEYDSISNSFDVTFYAFIVDLDIIEVCLDDYVPDKSNNGGGYAYANAIIRKIKERGY